ncbi:hypothetical protein [Aureimonas psammosilenae]|uniref:hypothetical protein n=1 Tax=Aureimonas psammosilenae TaxID=2495496 RepID=UPI001261065D|nr:hypothetical protein [Aureimonas psammosilenae]
MIARTTIESSGPKTLTDSEGFFGEAPPHEDIEALAELLVKGSYAPDPIAAFSECVRRGEDLQVDCLVATITPSINIAKDGADHDAMRDYFHRVSDVGQVRMLVRLSRLCLASTVTAFETAGSA